MTPTARTLKHLRELGYLAEVVEKRLPKCFITKDLFGCIDILAVKPGAPVLGVQCTSSSNVSARLRKAAALPDIEKLLQSNVVVEVWGWALRGPRGAKKEWTLTRRPLTLADLPELRKSPDGQG